MVKKKKKKKKKNTRKGGWLIVIKLINDDSKSVWYRFGSLTISIDLSNRTIADLFVDHYYTVPNGAHNNILGQKERVT